MSSPQFLREVWRTSKFWFVLIALKQGLQETQVWELSETDTSAKYIYTVSFAPNTSETRTDRRPKPFFQFPSTSSDATSAYCQDSSFSKWLMIYSPQRIYKIVLKLFLCHSQSHFFNTVPSEVVQQLCCTIHDKGGRTGERGWEFVANHIDSELVRDRTELAVGYYGSLRAVHHRSHECTLRICRRESGFGSTKWASDLAFALSSYL